MSEIAPIKRRDTLAESVAGSLAAAHERARRQIIEQPDRRVEAAAETSDRKEQQRSRSGNLPHQGQHLDVDG